MTVFKAFFQVARRNLTAVILYISLMLVITVLVFQSVSDTGGDLKVSIEDYRIGVINEDGDDLITRGLLDFLGSRALIVPIGTGENDAKDALFWREASYILQIPKGFGASFITAAPLVIQTQSAPDDYTYTYAQTYTNRFLATLKTYHQMNPGQSPHALIALVNEDLKDEVLILPTQERSPVHMKTVWYFRYLSYPLLAAISSGLGLVLASMRRHLLEQRARVASQSELVRNIQMLLASLLYSAIIWLIPVLLGVLITRLPVKELFTPRFLLILATSFFYMLICMSISLLISAFTQNRGAINGINNLVALGSSFLGGVFVPIEVMGDTITGIAKFLPAYWHTMAVRGLGDAQELSGGPMADYIKLISVLGLMLLVLLSATLLVNKIRRQKGT
ncbi:MAG: ABC transporter permease [Clostridiales bacterium]|nr:ABC transporter permease [Clostridiales bacterium]